MWRRLGPGGVVALAGLAAGTGALAVAVSVLPADEPAVAPATITTVAGGVGGPGPAAGVPLDGCSLSYAGGSLYTADDVNVRRIDARTGWLTTPAGDGLAGSRGDGGPATDAELEGEDTPDSSCSMAAALDAAGNLLIADGRVQVVAARTGTFYGQPMLARHIYTLAAAGYGVTDVRADRAGDLVMISTDYSACNGNCDDTPGMVQVLAAKTGTFYGTAMRAGRLYTVAGANEDATTAGNGGPSARAALGSLAQLAVDGAGNVLIADEGRTDTEGNPVVPPEIRVVAARDGTFYGQRMTAGDIYAIAGGGGSAANGVPATSASISALGVARDRAGNVIIGDGGRLRVLAGSRGTFYGQRMRAGDIYTVASLPPGGSVSAGDRGPALRARIAATYVAVDGTGNLAFADGNADSIRVVAAATGTFYGIRMRAGDIYSVAGTAHAFAPGGPATSAPLPGPPVGVAADAPGDLVIGFAGSGPAFVPARAGTYFGVQMVARHLYRIPIAASGLGRGPGPVAADSDGNVLIADPARNLVLVAPVRSGRFYGRAMRAGRIYAVAGDGSAVSSGYGGPAWAAGLSPAAVAADPGGDLFIVDNAVGVPGGRILMVAARSGTFYGIAMRAGHIYPVAGNGGSNLANGVPATDTGMTPHAIAVDAAGNLVLDTDYRVRVVAARSGTFYGFAMKTGYIYTVAGPFPGAEDAAVDRHGNVIVLDGAADVLRLIAVRSGTFYGQRVSAGHDYVIAGGGRGGLGPGIPATQAFLHTPVAIATDPAGQILIADNYGQRIEAVSP